MTASLKSYILVAPSASSHRYFQVLPAFYLDPLALSPELTQAGWRLAESHSGTGQRILVRPTARPPRWLEAWKDLVVDVEAHRIETGVAELEDGGFAIVAQLGEKIPGRKYIALAKNVIHNELN